MAEPAPDQREQPDAQSRTDLAAGKGASRPGAATRLRLSLALSGVLLSLVFAFAVEMHTLRSMARIIDSMEDRDEEVQLTLQIEAALEQVYGRQAELLRGSGAALINYEEARHHALTLMQRLGEITSDPRSAAALVDVRRATNELDRLFSEQISNAMRGDVGRVTLPHAGSYSFVVQARESIDRNLAFLHAQIEASREKLRSLQSESMHRLAAVLVAAALLFTGAILYLSRAVARPVALLAKGAMILGRGDLDHRIPIGSRDDFGLVAAELNSMAASSRDQRSRLVQSERLASIGQVAAGIARELRVPLQKIVKLLPQGRRDLDDDLAARCAAVELEALRGLQFVDGMVLLSHSESEPFLDLRPVDLRQLCDEVSDGLRPLADRTRVRLAVRGEGYALADRWKLRHVVFNITKNAVEAAGWKGEVHLQVADTEDGPQVRVSDTGPGIAPGLETLLFSPLFSTKESGSGLGLAVSRAIVRAHGGDIDAWNSDQGGAVFLLRFPGINERAERA